MHRSFKNRSYWLLGAWNQLMDFAPVPAKSLHTICGTGVLRGIMGFSLIHVGSWLLSGWGMGNDLSLTLPFPFLRRRPMVSMTLAACAQDVEPVPGSRKDVPAVECAIGRFGETSSLPWWISGRSEDWTYSTWGHFLGHSITSLWTVTCSYRSAPTIQNYFVAFYVTILDQKLFYPLQIYSICFIRGWIRGLYLAHQGKGHYCHPLTVS